MTMVTDVTPRSGVKILILGREKSNLDIETRP